MSDEPLRVLHVDDQHLWRSTVSDYLTLFGNYQITSVDSGAAALRMLSHSCFDIIISDFQMPEMDGIELLSNIRKKGFAIPFILFTGIKRDDLMMKAKKSGADFYLVKTGEPDHVFSELNQNIQQAVKRYQTIQTLLSKKDEEISSTLS